MVTRGAEHWSDKIKKYAVFVPLYTPLLPVEKLFISDRFCFHAHLSGFANYYFNAL
jgi:hypothetical protein